MISTHRAGRVIKPSVFWILCAALAGPGGCSRYQPTADSHISIDPLIGRPFSENDLPPRDQPGVLPATAPNSTDQSTTVDAEVTSAPTQAAPGVDSDVRADPSPLPGVDRPRTVDYDFFAVHFDPASAELRFATRRTLHDYAGWLVENPRVWLRLEGHCDRAGTLQFHYNLSLARAFAVKDRLVGLGVQPERLEVSSYGHDLLVYSGGIEDERALNRRVEFLASAQPPPSRPAERLSLDRYLPPPKRPAMTPRAEEIP